MSTEVAVRTATPSTAIGFSTSQDFEFTQRAAIALSKSTLVPEAFRAQVVDKKSREVRDNPNAVPNCIIALNMADRMKGDPLMIMQNLYIVEGRPSWSAQFVIAAINACGRFSPLRFDISPPGEEREIVYETVKWENNSRKVSKASCKIREQSCRAWAIEKATGERLEGPLVTMAMAEAEGWIGKNGSKWQTMQEVMIRYRSASFFGKLYAPDLLMGLQTSDEISDMVDITPTAAASVTLTSTAADAPPRPTREQFAAAAEEAGVEEKEDAPTFGVPLASGEIEVIDNVDDAITAILAIGDEVVRTGGDLARWLDAAKLAIDTVDYVEPVRSDNRRRLHSGIELLRSAWEAQQRKGQAQQTADKPATAKSIERYRFQPLKGAPVIDLDAMGFAHEMREALAGLSKADREKLSALNGNAMKRLHDEEPGLFDGVMNVMGA